MKDKMRFHGIFNMRVIKNGEVIQRITEKNLIVDGGFALVQQLLSAAAADKEVTQIQFGELTTEDFVEPESDWTAIPDPILAKTFDSVTFPTGRSVSFNWSLGTSEGNGVDISYFALLAADDTLFSAKSRAPIAKTSEFMLEGEWVINY